MAAYSNVESLRLGSEAWTSAFFHRKAQDYHVVFSTLIRIDGRSLNILEGNVGGQFSTNMPQLSSLC